MRELTYFYLDGCPFCRKADRILAQLREDDPALAAVPIRRVEESEQREIAEGYDYYFVPCLYLGDEKLHEGDPDEAGLRHALTRALNAPDG